ncbi:SPOR domain-containing protein [Arenibaculum pallidiluteum]|uniref:SPOR domain-containing protein n=1 Tax=Arenibaculum pallidiluteum TaxID=2812559 RepID=UPI001A973797|nr:SPOR domain-containing protein [Arenibaculum pallidiluteum]
MSLFASRPGAEDGSDPGYGGDRDPRWQPRGRSGPRRLVVLAGGGALLATLSAVAWYAAGSGGRSDGPPPLIQASTAPTKIRPDQPGGMEVPHQDKLVYERLHPGRAGTGKIERLLPGPEEPMPKPEPAPAPEPAASPSAPPLAPDEPEPSPAISVAAEGPVVAPPIAKIQPAPAAPMEHAPPAAAVSTAPPVARLPQVATLPPAAAPAAPARGGIRLQIASVPSAETAKSELSRLQRRFPSELGSLPATITRADLGAKGTYYRVQLGPVDEARASAVCTALKAQNVGCLLVRP